MALLDDLRAIALVQDRSERLEKPRADSGIRSTVERLVRSTMSKLSEPQDFAFRSGATWTCRSQRFISALRLHIASFKIC
jgi:hypothetical protein